MAGVKTSRLGSVTLQVGGVARTEVYRTWGTSDHASSGACMRYVSVRLAAEPLITALSAFCPNLCHESACRGLLFLLQCKPSLAPENRGQSRAILAVHFCSRCPTNHMMINHPQEDAATVKETSLILSLWRQIGYVRSSSCATMSQRSVPLSSEGICRDGRTGLEAARHSSILVYWESAGEMLSLSLVVKALAPANARSRAHVD